MLKINCICSQLPVDSWLTSGRSAWCNVNIIKQCILMRLLWNAAVRVSVLRVLWGIFCLFYAKIMWPWVNAYPSKVFESQSWGTVQRTNFYPLGTMYIHLPWTSCWCYFVQQFQLKEKRKLANCQWLHGIRSFTVSPVLYVFFIIGKFSDLRNETEFFTLLFLLVTQGLWHSDTAHVLHF